MSNLPPLPRYLTLEEAAQAMTDRTGKQWTPRQILGCAERHEITIFARISHAVKFVRVRPIEGRTNEIAADKGSLPILDTEAIRALLLAGEAHSTGWEKPATVDFFGEPVEAWQKMFELAPGEDAPLVRPDGCRVTAAGILQLVDTHTTPAQAEPQAAQVVAESASTAPDTSKGTPPKLAEADKAEILRLYNRGRGASVNAMAKQFNVSRPTIEKVLQRAGIKN